MTTTTNDVTGGVETHRDTHHAVALDQVGRLLGTHEFPADPAGYRQLLAWLESFGTVTRIGVEGTGCYGAGLTRFLRRHHLRVLEVNRPDRRARRRRGKSDPLDAESAARRALAGENRVEPKDTTTIVEAIRVLRNARTVRCSRAPRPTTSSWGPAKAVVAELAERGVDLTDRAAVDDAIAGSTTNNWPGGLPRSDQSGDTPPRR